MEWTRHPRIFCAGGASLRWENERGKLRIES
jgi:hypothetical protein